MKRATAGPWTAEFERAWRRSDRLFALLAPGALHERPIRLRHPFVFYLGHLPAFAWNQVCRGALGLPSFDAEFDTLFERGIDPLEESAAPEIDRWPDTAAIVAYRDRVRNAIREAIPDVLRRGDGGPATQHGRILRLAIEHELMHHETLLYMFAQLPFASKRRPDDVPRPIPGQAPAPERRKIAAGRVTLGAQFDAIPFGWDNEFPELTVEVDAFAIDARRVTNGEFRAFVEAGGYADRRWWLDDDWAWRSESDLARPVTWIAKDGGLAQRTMFEDVPLDDVSGWPVAVSCAEARAFARWRGQRLPTEAEFCRAAYTTPDGTRRGQPWGEAPVDATRANTGFANWAPTPAGTHPAGASAWGVEDLVGDLWEWTDSPFAPYPGFQNWHGTYPGYSSDFFDGRHVVLRGASWATDETLVRPSFRNWFQPHYPYVFATFRCAG